MTNLRSFSKFFKNLTDGQRREIERVLVDLENSEEITSLNSTLEFLRRKPNQHIPIPQLKVDNTSRGAVISWEAIKDQRIQSYEVEVSTNANFSVSSKTLTFGTTVILEGLGQVTFVRIRGVRTDGTTGPFSDTATLVPLLFSIIARTQEAFYIILTDSTAFTILGGSGSTFDYEPVLPGPSGFSMFFGQVYMYGDPEVAIRGTPDITLKVFGTTNSGITEHWRSTASDHHGTYSIGPFCIQHPETGNLQVRVDAQDSNPPNKFYTSEIIWAHLNSIELGSKPAI